LADDLQLSKTAISKWEADKAKPKMDNLYKLSNYYEIDVNELLKEKENISFEKAKFKGHSYAAYANNFTVNNNTSPEMLSLILENQKNISKSIQLQNDLIEKLLERK
jgi:transcriptional regulator with XRE-family HTH domain